LVGFSQFDDWNDQELMSSVHSFVDVLFVLAVAMDDPIDY
jgi:hypothetical protein